MQNISPSGGNTDMHPKAFQPQSTAIRTSALQLPACCCCCCRCCCCCCLLSRVFVAPCQLSFLLRLIVGCSTASPRS